MPRENMAVEQGGTLALMDKIGVICCALTNLSESVGPREPFLRGTAIIRLS